MDLVTDDIRRIILAREENFLAVALSREIWLELYLFPSHQQRDSSVVRRVKGLEEPEDSILRRQLRVIFFPSQKTRGPRSTPGI